MNDNPQLRALFALPPILASTSTALVVPDLPPQQKVTGDAEVDAVLWLRAVIKIGQPSLIEKAMEAAKRIKTPLKDLEKRYATHLMQRNGMNVLAALGSFGFADLDDLVQTFTNSLALRNEAAARFGIASAVLEDTPADKACAEALVGLRPGGQYHEYPRKKAAARFAGNAALVPHTLDDCLHVLKFAHTLWQLRRAVDKDAAEGRQETYAHERHVFDAMATTPPRTVEEALRVFKYLEDEDRDRDVEGPAIVRNLIQGPRLATPRGKGR